MKWQAVAFALTALLLGGSGILGVDSLFAGLFQLSGVSEVHSGDILCGSTCESYVNVSTWYWRICFEYPGPGQRVYVATSERDFTLMKSNISSLPDTVLYKKARRGRTLWVNLDNVDQVVSTDPLVDVEWLVPTYGKNWRPLKDGDCWDRGEVNKVKLVGHKSPEQTVKWGFNVTGIGGELVDVDPLWIGQSVTINDGVTVIDQAWIDSQNNFTYYQRGDDLVVELNGEHYVTWQVLLNVKGTVMGVGEAQKVIPDLNVEWLYRKESDGWHWEANVTGIEISEVSNQQVVNLIYDVSNSSFADSPRFELIKKDTGRLNSEQKPVFENVSNYLVMPDGRKTSFKDLDDNGLKTSISEDGKIVIGNLSSRYDATTKSIVLDPTTQSTCGTLNEANETYLVNTNLSASSDCFSITADHIVLDGGGYNISYAQSSDGIGIDIGNAENVTVKNFGRIDNLATGTSRTSSPAIHFSTGVQTNSFILNNTINVTGPFSSSNNNHGIYFESGASDGTVVANNTVTAESGRLTGVIAISSGDNIVIRNNILSGAGVSFSSPALVVGIGSSPTGIIIEDNYIACAFESSAIGGSNANLNNVSRNNITCSSNQPAFFWQRDGDDNNVSDNRVVHSGSGEAGIAFSTLTQVPDGNLVWNNLFNVTGDTWVEIVGSPSSNNMSRDSFSATNIVGGSTIAGNYYANNTHNGFSQVCTDGDSDGICDENKSFVVPEIQDFYPLTNPVEEAVSELAYFDPTPANDTVLLINDTYINFSITNTTDLNSVKLNFNGTNISLYGDGLVALWHLNNETQDHSGFNHTLFKITNGVSDINCGEDQAAVFGTGCSYEGTSGTGTYLQANDSELLSILENLTVELWVNSGNGGAFPLALISKQNTTAAAGYSILIDGTSIDFDINNGTGSSTSATISSFPQDQWIHVAGSYNGTHMAVYLNGQLDETQPKVGVVPDTDNNLTILGGVNIFRGIANTVDEVRLWNRTLSGDEIYAHYRAEIGRYYANFTDLPDGNYTFSGWANQTDGTVISNVTRTFHVDAFPPIPPNLNVTVNIQGNVSVDQNSTFTFNANVTCVHSECGDLNITLDPTSITNVTLNTPDLDILEDAEFDEDTTGQDGTEVSASVDALDGTGELAVFKFNLTKIPDGATVINATVCFFMITGSDNNIELYYSSNDTWDEADVDPLCGDGTICQNLYDIFFQEYVATIAGSGSNNEPLCYGNLASQVTQSIDAGNSSVTFAINNSDIADTADFYTVGFKEIVTEEDRPQLMVNYSYIVKGGIISEVEGDTPFYVIPSPNNPNTSVDMQEGDSVNLSWTINATGNPNTVWNFFVNVSNATNSLLNVSEIINVSITDPGPPAPQGITVNFTFPTDPDNSVVNKNHTYLNVSIVNNGTIDTVIFNWNGTNFTLYDKSLVGIFNFDNNTNDSSGRNWFGVPQGDVYCGTGESGYFGTSCTVNGTPTSMINISNIQGVGELDAVTVSVWSKFENPQSRFADYTMVGQTHQASGIGLNSKSWYILNSRPSFPSIWEGGNSTEAWLTSASSSGCNDDFSAADNCFLEWHNHIGRYNGTGVMRAIDGILNHDSDQILGTVGNNSWGVTVGNDVSGTDLFNGSIDQVVIWNRSLSDDEIMHVAWRSEIGLYFLNLTLLDNANYSYYVWFNQTDGSSNQTETRNITINQTIDVTDDCSCPGSGDWVIDDGSSCTLSTACHILPNSFYLVNGKLRITSTGSLTAQCPQIRDQGPETLVFPPGGLFCR